MMPLLRRSQFEPPAVFRALYRPLGRIAFVFADLEKELAYSLNALLGGASGTAIDFIFQSFYGRTELFHLLAMQLCDRGVPTPGVGLINWPRARGSDELRKSAKTIVRGLSNANDDRNNLLHGAWSGLSTTGRAYSKDRYRVEGGRFNEIPIRGVTVELLREEAEYITIVRRHLADWTERAIRWNQPELWRAPLPDILTQHSPIGSLLRDNRKAGR